VQQLFNDDNETNTGCLFRAPRFFGGDEAKEMLLLSV